MLMDDYYSPAISGAPNPDAIGIGQPTPIRAELYELIRPSIAYRPG